MTGTLQLRAFLLAYLAILHRIVLPGISADTINCTGDPVICAGTDDADYIVVIGDKDVTLSGNGGDDILGHDGDGNTVISGGSGDDLVGKLGEGNVTLSGDEGDDTLYHVDRGESFDGVQELLVSGGEGADLIYLQGHANIITVSGGTGPDNITTFGTEGLDLLSVYGDDGNDNIHAEVASADALVSGGAGDDAMDVNATVGVAGVSGGAGNDVMSALVVGRDAVVSGGDGDDTMTVVGYMTDGIGVEGGAGNDAVVVGALADSIYGGIYVHGDGGDDNVTAVGLTYGQFDVHGGAGTDRMEVYGAGFDLDVSGGDGNDALNVYAAGYQAVVSGGEGDDDIQGNAAGILLHVDGGAGEDRMDLGAFGFNVRVSGNDGDDDMDVYGGAIDGLHVQGGDGADDMTVTGAALNKFVVEGGAGDDRVVVDASGLDFTFTLPGLQFEAEVPQSGTVSVSGGEGDDAVWVAGNAAQFSVTGGSGNDNLTFSGSGSSTMDGGSGNDRLRGGNVSDTLWGGTGNDTISGAGGDDYLHGEDDADSDKLLGGTGSDVLSGGAADLLYGGEDDDILVGADGSTRFVGGPGVNVIIDGRGLNYQVLNAQGGTDRYAVCAENRRGLDWGCSDGFLCRLSNGRSPGHRQAGDMCLLVCDVNNIMGLDNALVARPKCFESQLIQASYLLSFATCFDGVEPPNIDALIGAVGDQLGIRNCLVGLNLTLPGSSARRRHLLQLTEEQIEIGVEASASSDAELQLLRDTFTSPGFAAFLASLFARFGLVAETALSSLDGVPLASATSDPHFVSARGDHFDFVGRAERSYCVLSDERVHVNARLTGTAGAPDASGASIRAADASGASIRAADARGAEKGGNERTWMGQISVMYGSDRVLVDASSRPGTPYAASFGTVLLNGAPLEGKLGTRGLPSGLTVTRRKTRVYISAPGVMEMVVEVVRAAFWETNKGPGRNFLKFEAAGAVHGILGQSYAKQGTEVPMEGSDEDYETSGMFAADCRFAKFLPRSARRAARM
eukprot:jgi/Mesvir1/2449/Mv20037-RA.2